MCIFVTMAVLWPSDAVGMEIDHICNTKKKQPEYDNLSVLVVLYACETYMRINFRMRKTYILRPSGR